MAKYDLSQAAAADLERLYIFGIRTFGEKLADQYYDGLQNRFEQIADMPKLYPLIDAVKPGVRRSVYGSHSIFYIAVKDHVTIIRILGREDPKRAL